MILKEAWMYINGEKKFSNIQDAKSFDDGLIGNGINTPARGNIVFEEDGNTDDGDDNDENSSNGLHVEKVVTKLNGSVYLYIPKDSNQDHPPDLDQIAHDLDKRSMNADGGGYKGGSKCQWGAWSPDSEGRCIQIKDEVKS